MTKLWDYFMRRKALLMVAVVVFAASSFLTYRALNIRVKDTTPQYISIDEWNTDEVEIPQTGGMMPFIAVMQPNDLIALNEPVPRHNEITEPISDTPNVPEDENLPNPDGPEMVNPDELPENTEESDDTNEQVADEDLDNLEQTTLPGSVVMEVLPPNKQMSDEVLNAAIDALNQQTTSLYLDSDITEGVKRSLYWWVLPMSVLVLGLGGYLTYWHFRR